ncbi:hypothetical protein [uncultured Porphyromonas sp.]|uniref:hypothetical protein n=1 Tax=uncultured Porphyromonas sp. TaxID=159274 RepID=UPI0026063842|nr:hypothetical protein [uncultured Porphyromonas sp.]
MKLCTKVYNYFENNQCRGYYHSAGGSTPFLGGMDAEIELVLILSRPIDGLRYDISGL